MAGIRPISDTSYPGAAELREAQEDRTWWSADFSWSEDSVYGWRAVALFGGLLFLEGSLAWLWAGAYTDRLPGSVMLLGLLLIVGGAIAALYSYTEDALAMLAGAIVAGYLCVADRLAPYPGAGAVFTQWTTFESDLETLLAFWVVGGVLLGLGTFQAVKANRDLPVDP